MRSSRAINRQAGHSASSVDDHSPDGAPDLDTIIRALMTEYAESARVIELYYWSQEPGVVDIIRAVMRLPKRSRASVQAFLAMAPDLKLIHTKVDDLGCLTLFSPQVAQTLTAARHALGTAALPSAG